MPQARASALPVNGGDAADSARTIALQTLRRVRHAFAHSTTTATLTDPSHSDRLAQAYATARPNEAVMTPHWTPPCATPSC